MTRCRWKWLFPESHRPGIVNPDSAFTAAVLLRLFIFRSPVLRFPVFRDHFRFISWNSPLPVLGLLALLLSASSCAPPPRRSDARVLSTEIGEATWYGNEFHGRKTASGERFNENDLTAAHPSLPFGTVCRVTNLSNGRSVIVRINDRGPFTKGRVMDLSKRAMGDIGGIRAGVVEVKVEVLKRGSGK
jgi:rare lipoprotein A